MPYDIAPQTIALLLISAFASGAFGSVFGLGAGIVMSFAVTSAFGVAAVVPVVTAAMMVGNAGRVFAFKGEVKPKTLAIALVSGAPAAAAGAQVHASLDPVAVAFTIGLVLVATVPIGRFVRSRQISLGPRGLALASAALGFVGSLGIGAGGLAVPVLTATGLSGAALVATDSALGVGTALVRVVAFVVLGVLPPDLLAVALLIGLATVPGSWAGAWLARRAGARRHTLAIETFASLAGLFYLWQAFIQFHR